MAINSEWVVSYIWHGSKREYEMKNRVYGTKLLSTVSVSALFLVIGAAQAAEQKTATPGNLVAGQAAGPAFGAPGNAGIRNYQGNYQGAGQGTGQGSGTGSSSGKRSGHRSRQFWFWRQYEW